MGEADNYRTLNQMDLRRVFTSLGLPRETFRASGTTSNRPPFDAVLNADATRPDGVWLFKGSNFFLYNLLSGEIEEGPTPVAAAFGAGALPELFKTGIHSAVFAGPAFPHLWTFFKDEMYVTMDSTQGFKVIEGPRGVLGAWASGAWTDPSGTFKTPGVPVALHGLGTEFDGMAHFFKDGQYIRHNLRTGETVTALAPIGDAWKLPEPFVNRIDLAFYGTGPNEENIFFISGDQFALYDFRTDQVLATGSVEERFPAFAQFMGRPQLFLAEDYSMDTLVGPTHLGRLIDTRTIGAGSKITRLLVTQTTDTTKASIARSLLQSQDESVVSNFYDQLDENISSSDESERYKYQLDADFHGEAEATSLWGGEVDASLDASGSTENIREALSEATFKSIRRQVDESKRATEQKTYNSASEIESTVKVLKQETFEETNTSDRVRIYEFFEQLQPYITLLTLQKVRVAYSDGTGDGKIVELGELDGLLNEVLVDPALGEKVAGYIRGELSKVANFQGEMNSLLVDGGSSELALRPNLSSKYEISMPDGTTQTVSVRGYLKADRPWIEPTFTITCVQR